MLWKLVQEVLLSNVLYVTTKGQALKHF